METDTLETLWSPKKLASFLEVHRSTIYRWIHEGKVKTIRVGGGRRILQSEVYKITTLGTNQKNETKREQSKEGE